MNRGVKLELLSVLLIVFTILFGAGLLYVDRRRQPLSEPHEMDIIAAPPLPTAWETTPVVPIEHTLLILPPVWSDTGVVDRRALRFHANHESLLARAWPRNLYLVPTKTIQNHLSQMSPYRSDGNYELPSDFLASMTEFARPTIVLSYKFSPLEGDTVRVEATLICGDGFAPPVIRAQDVPSTFTTQAAGPILRQLLEDCGITDDPALLAAHDSLPGGELVWAELKTPEQTAFWADATNPRWEELGATAAGDPVLFGFRAITVRENAGEELGVKLDPGPLPDSAPLALMRARVDLLLARGMTDEAIRQWQQLGAIYPGAAEAMLGLLLESGDEHQTYLEHAEDMTRWAERVPPSPLMDYLRALSHLRAADEARGNQYANQVSKMGWTVLGEQLAAGRPLAESAYLAGALPPSARLRMEYYHRQGGRDQTIPIHAQTIRRWPASYDTWSVQAHYLQPRWTGLQSQGTALIDDALAALPSNGSLAGVVFKYHAAEAALQYDGDLYGMRSWAEEWGSVQERQINALLEMGLLPSLARRDRARIFMMAAATARADHQRPLLELEPTLWRDIRGWEDTEYTGLSYRAAIIGLIGLGEWQELSALLWAVRKHDDSAENEWEPCGITALCSDHERRAYFAFVGAAHQKDPAALALLRSEITGEPYYAVLAGLAAYLLDDVQPSDLDAVENMQVDPSAAERAEYHDVAALLHAAMGNADAAHEAIYRSLETINGKPQATTFPWAREEAERLLGIREAADR